MTDDRDVRDPRLDALLRTHLPETPPPAVDAAILTAAQRAVDAPRRARLPRATQPWRWWMPLAAAAVIGVIVIGIVPLAPTLVEPPAPKVSDVPAGPPSSSEVSVDSQAARGRSHLDAIKIEPAAPMPKRAAAAPAPARSEKPGAAKPESARPGSPSAQASALASSALSMPRDASGETRSPTPKAVAAPPAAPQLGAARELADRDAAASLQSKTDSAFANRSGTPSPAAGPAADARTSAAASRPDAPFADQRAKKAARTMSADEWIAQIRTLRNEARMTEAERALVDFRAAFGDADARLPKDLRAWAKTVR